MPSLSNVILIGHLVDDPELRQVGSDNTPVANFTLAINHYNPDGEDPVSFVDCTAWRGTAESVSQYVNKGDPLAVQGELRQECWQTDEGENRSKLKVQAHRTPFLKSKDEPNEDDEDIPF